MVKYMKQHRFGSNNWNTAYDHSQAISVRLAQALFTS